MVGFLSLVSASRGAKALGFHPEGFGAHREPAGFSLLRGVVPIRISQCASACANPNRYEIRRGYSRCVHDVGLVRFGGKGTCQLIARNADKHNIVLSEIWLLEK